MARNNKLITAANFRDFDWNKAKLFYHIVKCGSFTKAARLAGTDRTSLTRQVQMLEDQIGSVLIARKAGVGSIMLTRKGQELLDKVAPFFLEMKGFCGNHHVELKGQKKRKIRVTTTYAFSAYLISDLLLDYSEKNPYVTFELIADDYILDIILNDVDIAIQPLDPRLKEQKVEGLQYDYLFSIEKKLFASPKYISTYGEPQIVEDLINHNIISFPQPEPHPHINWILTLGMPEGELHSPVYTSNSIDSLVNAAEKGVGIVASYEDYKIIKNSNLKNILPHVKDMPFKEYFIYPKYLAEDSLIMDIKTYLKEKLNPNNR